MRSDMRESRRTMPFPTHSHAASVATITLITLMAVKRVRPSSKLPTASPSDSAEWDWDAASRRDTAFSRVALDASNDAARSLVFVSSAS